MWELSQTSCGTEKEGEKLHEINEWSEDLGIQKLLPFIFIKIN